VSSSQLKNSSKTSIAAVAGVGAVAAGAAALQESGAHIEAPVAAVDGAQAPSASPVAASQVTGTADQGQQIDELVQAYLGEGQVGSLSAEALSAADLAEVLPEPELLEALASHPGVQVAQAGGGIGEILTGIGGSVGGGAVAGGLLVGGGLLATGLIIDEVSGSN